MWGNRDLSSGPWLEETTALWIWRLMNQVGQHSQPVTTDQGIKGLKVLRLSTLIMLQATAAL
jgi:hypothetical protein